MGFILFMEFCLPAACENDAEGRHSAAHGSLQPVWQFPTWSVGPDTGLMTQN
jgi:hypothetical protein